MRTVINIAMATAVILAIGCGSRPPPPYSEHPVDFAYEIDGQVRHLSQARGRPVVLVLVRTAELTSDLFIDQVVNAFTHTAGKTFFLVLSIAPNEAPMLDEYVELKELPFSIGLADWSVAQGGTRLGLIPVVPSTYLIGPDGRVRDMAPGFVAADVLIKAIEKRGWR
jgi:hypothetical protein